MIRYLSPPLKLLLSLVFVAIIVSSQWHMTLAICSIAIITSLFISGIHIRDVIKAFKPMWFFIIVLTAITAVTSLEIYSGVLILKLILVTLSVSVLTQTTSQRDLQTGIISLLKPLKFLRVPTEDIAFVITLTICFIPRITEEWQKLIYARQARGIMLSNLTPKNRIKVTFLTLEKLLINSLKIAEKTAISADSRCYGLGNFTPRHGKGFTGNDYGVLVLFLIFCIFLVLLEFLH